MNKRKIYKKKRYLIPFLLVVAVLMLRLMLPFIVKNHVNKVLAGIPSYYGQVEDIDISLIRGAYVIDNLYLNKVNASSQVPFLNFPKTDISIEWKSLFKGEIVSEIVMTSPEVISVFEDQSEKENTSDIDDWSKALTDLVPIDINNLEIRDGKFAFVEVTADPTIDLHLDKVQLSMSNLRNVVEKSVRLPSTIHATAISVGEGNFKLDGKMNIIKKIPDMDISFSLENATVTALNDFTNHYAGIDFTKGDFNVFSEVAIADGYLKGYVKPILKDAVLIGKEDGFVETLWEGFVGFFKFVLKNQKENTLATKVPIAGDLNTVDSKVWPTITNIFKNAWVEAFKNVIDNDIDFKDAEKESGKE